MDYIKFFDLTLFQLELIKQGYPKDLEVETTATELSNLYLASQFAGNSDKDNLIIEGRINSILSQFNQSKPFFVNLLA